MPVDRLPSHALRIQPAGPKRGNGRALERLAARLRALPVAVIGRIADGALWLDLRCLDGETAEGDFAEMFGAAKLDAAVVHGAADAANPAP